MLKLEFETSNAAFDKYPFSEMARVLEKVADCIYADHQTTGIIRDRNGNTIGKWEINRG